jgi:hypothetical protein
MEISVSGTPTSIADMLSKLSARMVHPILEQLLTKETCSTSGVGAVLRKARETTANVHYV